MLIITAAGRLLSAEAFCLSSGRFVAARSPLRAFRPSQKSIAAKKRPVSTLLPTGTLVDYSQPFEHGRTRFFHHLNAQSQQENEASQREKIILWRGEGTAGYSLELRHLELANSIAAASDLDFAPELTFDDMLEYDGDRQLSDTEVDLFGGATQFVTSPDGTPISSDSIVNATKRCSLIRESYEVIAKADTYEELAKITLESGNLSDVLRGGIHENATWRVRLRQYGSASTNNQGSRYGHNVKSPVRAEKQAIRSMAPLFLKFSGKVQLNDPDCSLYLFEGTKDGKIILARVLAKGPKTSTIAPRTRICVTNTPLEPVAAYNLCNIARVKDGHNVLDPYAGSCATLLAAASVAPECTTVGIEISLKKFVKKEDILLDFSSRDLRQPAAIIRGDSMAKRIRDKARKAIGGKPFDAIVTDPPYGIREKAGNDEMPPLVQLFTVIAEDRDAGSPLLKTGGRLAAFVPISPGQELNNSLPNDELMQRAGMVLTEIKEQRLNEHLGRWLVAYTCIR